LEAAISILADPSCSPREKEALRRRSEEAEARLSREEGGERGQTTQKIKVASQAIPLPSPEKKKKEKKKEEKKSKKKALFDLKISWGGGGQTPNP